MSAELKKKLVFKGLLRANILWTIPQKGNMEARQKTWNLNNFCINNIHFCISKQSKFLFMSLPLCCPFWSGKYPNFRQMLQMFTIYYTFLERRQPEDNKHQYYALCPQSYYFQRFALGLKTKFSSFNAILTNSSSMLLLSRKQSIDFLSRSMSQFLYISITGLKWVNKGTQFY